jgi:hypothetical protein
MSGRVVSIVAAIAMACVLPAGASAGTVFQFAPTNPKAGSKFVDVRAIQTPAGYDRVQLPDSAHVFDLYLVRHADAPSVHSVADARLLPRTVHSVPDVRLIPLGRFDPLHVSTRYRLPRLGTGTYAMAAQCLDCKVQKLYVIGVGRPMWGPEPVMLLHASATSRPFPPFVAVGLFALLLAAAAWIASRRRQDRREEPIVRNAATATR